MNLYEKELSLSLENIEFEFRYQKLIPLDDFILNPRRLRGSDFLMRWSQGVWSEKRLIQAVNDTDRYFAIPYGPSGTAPGDDPKEHELYFERLEDAGLGAIKRPDVLLFRKANAAVVKGIIKEVGGIEELPFTPEDKDPMRKLLSYALLAVECENSLWKVSLMPGYGEKLRPMKRLGGKFGLPKNTVLPTVILKEEDKGPLNDWQDKNCLQIHIWHAFYDRAYGITFNYVNDLINQGLIEGTTQIFQAPGGATTRKKIYKVYYHYAYPLAESLEEPSLIPAHIVDKNGHILPYVKFEGGVLKISSEALSILDRLSN
ncbi:MAG TPA: AccI family restriction endonuclease [bacterium]|nr:AccI family restriction endonuclease [bacterium]